MRYKGIICEKCELRSLSLRIAVSAWSPTCRQSRTFGTMGNFVWLRAQLAPKDLEKVIYFSAAYRSPRSTKGSPRGFNNPRAELEVEEARGTTRDASINDLRGAARVRHRASERFCAFLRYERTARARDMGSTAASTAISTPLTPWSAFKVGDPRATSAVLVNATRFRYMVHPELETFFWTAMAGACVRPFLRLQRRRLPSSA